MAFRTYKRAEGHITMLEASGATLMYNVDATDLSKTPGLKDKVFDRIFSTPHTVGCLERNGAQAVSGNGRRNTRRVTRRVIRRVARRVNRRVKRMVKRRVTRMVNQRVARRVNY
ncbi:hypothetical protein HanRHA438_Chr07g0288621 [Helianthus annuus]|uniref:25S rRNA (uridine-N(3))-methyltransferase BMT5-like domain-containing protein n=1 Tax=Helianthus annuus TaxID=4232 RepID=A0A9K3IIT0_HELAN|nr:hypothetical protein HanXRQr2_Chr07g0278701 [Helianthus annuus]KAJ0549017.1 hypothetical protein HanHA300_Chr07g0228791 [Helianthus annuus]KAJ0561929.1 hypothetical protein HanHA89_Chr07g0245511 [Helianthus annuus]KAJ0730129.1 hypothetical protein HanOQP8_Chr07g0236491 [Helianthus annuus]KAJ0903437.1 hypothetical protein HanPSC8_Chr07g0269841 [Helianthus annuus]